jgi:hypothetical protein
VAEFEGELTRHEILLLCVLLVVGNGCFGTSQSLDEARHLLSFGHHVEPDLYISSAHCLKISNSAKFAFFTTVLEWYAVSTGMYLSTFRMIVVPGSSGSNSRRKVDKASCSISLHSSLKSAEVKCRVINP